SLGSQQTSQHTRTGEWVLQVQPIEAMHDRQLRLRDRPWQVGHGTHSVTGRYLHHLDSALLAAADNVAGGSAAMTAGRRNGPRSSATPHAPPTDCLKKR